METNMEGGLLKAWNAELRLGFASVGDGEPANDFEWRLLLSPICILTLLASPQPPSDSPAVLGGCAVWEGRRQEF